ncbi:MAG TPA: hypothetical protein PLA43_09015 [Bryobacteraceae bacterium]|nr:hypothetical protein [Bryobacteraceae bacterium]HOQ44905.1 hypothetical protein [Bryobacteraceae bacterium]HPU72085.1 hypothetical protein [Bryobacteraceae bacterium]
MVPAALVLCGLLLTPEAPTTAGPSREAVQAFNNYVRVAESGLDARLQAGDLFLWANTPERRQFLRRGSLVCEPRGEKGDRRAPGGLIHDWIGAVFIPKVTLGEVLELLQDYDNHKNTYQPVVVDSKTLERKGNDFKIRLRLFKRKLITVVLNSEYDVRYQPINSLCWHSRSRSTRIVEIRDPGGPQEREMPAGRDRGFLWRLNSYWAFNERDGGVYVECEAISLSRSIPSALAWLLDPMVRNLPKEFLGDTLTATRARLMKAR